VPVADGWVAEVHVVSVFLNKNVAWALAEKTCHVTLQIIGYFSEAPF
jgi:hypothetical protein